MPYTTIFWSRHNGQRRADDLQEAGEQRLVGQPLIGCFGDAEVDHLHLRRAVDGGDQYVTWFDVPMDDALWVGVLHGGTDVAEQVQPFGQTQLPAVAEFRNRQAFG